MDVRLQPSFTGVDGEPGPVAAVRASQSMLHWLRPSCKGQSMRRAARHS